MIPFRFFNFSKTSSNDQPFLFANTSSEDEPKFTDKITFVEGNST
jgi:hypothetical protein